MNPQQEIDIRKQNTENEIYSLVKKIENQKKMGNKSKEHGTCHFKINSNRFYPFI